jgi:DNA polymerase III alpha subunit
VLDKLTHRVARLDKNKKHNTGVYVTECPHNPVDMLSTLDHKTAEDRGYFKLDFLNVSLYKDIKDEQHLVSLMEKEPLWDLLTEPEFSNQLFHVGDHSTILQTMKPQSIIQLASVLAIIRPAKRHLLGKSWDTVMKEVWTKPKNGEYYFKKAHAVAYAHAIVVQMNLICEMVSAQHP